MKPEIVSLIDGIDVTLNAGGMNTINIVLAFVMYGVALGIKPGMFVEVFKRCSPSCWHSRSALQYPGPWPWE